MTVEWLSEEAVAAAPVPLLWWDRVRARGVEDGARDACRWASGVTEACRDPYLDVVGESLDTLGIHPATGQLMVTYQALLRALLLGHERVLGSALVPPVGGAFPGVPGEEVVALVLWELAYEFGTLVLGGCTVGHALTGSDRMELAAPGDAEHRSLGWANAALVGHAGGVGRRAPGVHTALGLAARAQRERWPLPPYEFEPAASGG